MPVGSGLFILNGGTLTPMAEAPYNNEDALQQLLAEHPELLPGDAMDPDDPRRFVLVGREVHVAGYRLDHLFIDHEAVPTLVETKLEANREIRRLVVAQMLDYAPNAASEWDAGKLSGWLADIAGGDTDALAGLDHQFETDDEFWAQAEQNVRDGKVRLLFLSSEISQDRARGRAALPRHRWITPAEAFRRSGIRRLLIRPPTRPRRANPTQTTISIVPSSASSLAPCMPSSTSARVSRLSSLATTTSPSSGCPANVRISSIDPDARRP